MFPSKPAHQRSAYCDECLALAAQMMRPIERVAVLCELATSRDPGCRRIARLLARRFPHLPSARSIRQYVGSG